MAMAGSIAPLCRYKHDRQGNWLDKDDAQSGFQRSNTEVWEGRGQLSDITHLDGKGMQCVDCHFEQDSHGNGSLYSEPRAAVEIDCIDCHGGVKARASLKTSNSAAPAGGTDLATLRTPFGTRRFEWVNGELVQRSMWFMAGVYPRCDHCRPVRPSTTKSGWPRPCSTTALLWWILQIWQTKGLEVVKMSCYTCHTPLDD